MSKNIEINIATSNNTYEALYPKTTYSNMADVLNIVNTTGTLDVSRLSRIPVDIVKGQYTGTLSGFPTSDTWKYTNDKKWYCYLLFPGKTRRPDFFLVIGENGFGYFSNLDESKDVCYRSSNAIFCNENFKYNSSTLTTVGTKSIEFRAQKKVDDYDNNNYGITAASNGIYFAPERAPLVTTGNQSFTLSNGDFLNANGWNYWFYGFYFS